MFIYKRGELTIILNPSVEEKEISVDLSGEVLYNINGKLQIEKGKVIAPALSFNIVK